MDDARRLEADGQYGAALVAYQSCETTGEDSRFCAARAKLLKPQAADGYTGWTVLAGVRHRYRELGPVAAATQVQAALDANPTGPAASQLRAWLANERRLTHSPDAEEARDAVIRDPGAAPSTRAALANEEKLFQRRARQRYTAIGLGAVAAGYLGVALRGRGTAVSATPLVIGWFFLAITPALLAWAWGASDWPGVLATGSAVVAGVAVAPRAPAWLAAAGTASVALLCAYFAGWFDSMGLG